ncbi:MAG: hypothetical protein HQL52_13515, partial [Magnetococcales bacterium]|nr:hypothetical protein [Magnetococcales bacterium]
MSQFLKNAPILCIDVAGFTKLGSIPKQRLLIERLQGIVTESARFFMAYGNVWKKWRRHGTGDGYYFMLDNLPPAVALKYADNVARGVEAHHREHGESLPIQLRMVLMFGDVELVEDQYLGDPLSDGERFLSYPPLKDLLATSEQSSVLILSDLFYTQWRLDPARNDPELAVGDPKWQLFSFADKHDKPHQGYVPAPGFPETVPSPDAEPEPPPQLRVLILLGHFLEEPLPEAVHSARSMVNGWLASGLNVEIRVEQASLAALKREAGQGIDLLIFYGHGDAGGRLLFKEGGLDYARLKVGDLWDNLSAAFIFACHGATFARELPSPWLAFTDTIWRSAPRGFMQALIRHLPGNTLSQAIDQAKASTEEFMASKFPELLTTSTPDPELPPISAGTPTLTRLSPGLATDRVEMDYYTVYSERVDYPEHDPFVGRIEALETLLKIPELDGDDDPQRAVWVSGDAGLGKSALLRQLAFMARDMVFHEADQPLHLFQMNCWSYTNAEDLERQIRKKISPFYGLEKPAHALPALFNHLAATPHARHLWILDDLTYLSVKLDGTSEAQKLVTRILQGAAGAGVVLQLVVSARRPGSKRWPAIPLGPLSPHEAQVLAQNVMNRLYESPPDEPVEELLMGAERIFQFVRGSTALYKRALFLAAENGMGFRELAERLETDGDLDQQSIHELAVAMARFEVEQLKELESRHGFAYRHFMGLCYSLMTRTAGFSEEELKTWFGDHFQVPGSRVTWQIGCKNGLRLLTRLGFLSLQRDGEQKGRYIMPPNQRLPLRSLQDPEATLPEQKIPLRGVRERVSLALERAKSVGFAAAGDFQALVQDYKDNLHESEAAGAVFQGMLVQAELEWKYKRPEAGISIYDEIVALFYQHRNHYPSTEVVASEPVAKALVNKGVRLGQLG